MRIKVDFSKCVRCNACVDACPQLADERSMKILDCDGCNACANACAKRAFYEVEGVLRIDPERCDNCGDCVQACEKHAIIQQSAFPSKCDLCLAYERPLCVDACPYGAITLELSDDERDKMTDVVGWSVEKINGTSVVESEFNEIIKTPNGVRYALNVKEPSYDEVCVAEKLIAIIRKGSFDENAFEALFDEYCDE
ncbi:4Fe-4S binding protein, partial [Candidatus Micrarchaeota archaeon]|nr:4Fe-4S binding protein [Candidatus Micrarchaeota archaeon]